MLLVINLYESKKWWVHFVFHNRYKNFIFLWRTS